MVWKLLWSNFPHFFPQFFLYSTNPCFSCLRKFLYLSWLYFWFFLFLQIDFDTFLEPVFVSYLCFFFIIFSRWIVNHFIYKKSSSPFRIINTKNLIIPSQSRRFIRRLKNVLQNFLFDYLLWLVTPKTLSLHQMLLE